MAEPLNVTTQTTIARGADALKTQPPNSDWNSAQWKKLLARK